MPVVDFFHDTTPVFEPGKYTTDLFTDKARQILKANDAKNDPSFIYLAYNAPHEPTHAPDHLIEKMRELHPTTEVSRLEHLATVYHMDIQIEQLVEESKTFERETIFIFQSDNGGATQKFRGKRTKEMRSCNYPYKGYKNTLYEGGTISPSFIYSTKTKFARNRVNSVFHVMDWFPTILDFAGAKYRKLTHIDGVSQRPTLRSKFNPKPRENFIYGLLNEFVDETKRKLILKKLPNKVLTRLVMNFKNNPLQNIFISL